jgi:hypothetical protein
VKRAVGGPLAALFLTVYLLGGAQAQGEGRPEAPEAPSCLERPIVVVYLHRLQDQVMDRWTLPEDIPANQVVVVRLRLGEDGALLTYKLVSWTNRRIANSVELALAHSRPFGWIPDDATCLVGRSIEMQFENPY